MAIVPAIPLRFNAHLNRFLALLRMVDCGRIGYRVPFAPLPLSDLVAIGQLYFQILLVLQIGLDLRR